MRQRAEGREADRGSEHGRLNALAWLVQNPACARREDHDGSHIGGYASAHKRNPRTRFNPKTASQIGQTRTLPVARARPPTLRVTSLELSRMRRSSTCAPKVGSAPTACSGLARSTSLSRERGFV